MVSNTSTIQLQQIASNRAFTLARGVDAVSPCPLGCSGHGACVNGVCQCSPVWIGVGCDQPVCLTDDQGRSCSGNGTCTSVNNQPQCACYTGFTGSNCNLPDCSASPLNSCSSTGTCSFVSIADAPSTSLGLLNSSTLALQCSCPTRATSPDCSLCNPGFYGAGCSQLNCSFLSDCSGNGQCFESNGALTCSCNSGYIGATCSAFACPGSPALPCSGHGTCLARSLSATSAIEPYCQCDAMWTGTACQSPSCVSSNGAVCGGHGTCVTTSANGSVECRCATSWSGSDCSQPLCSAMNSCSSRGTCLLDTAGNQFCACSNGWTGANCAEEATTSSSSNKTLVALVVTAVIVAVAAIGAFVYLLMRRSAPRQRKITNAQFGPAIRANFAPI